MRKKRILTEEHKKKIGLARKGKKKVFSDEAIENIRLAAAKRRGIKRGPYSEEHKEKIRLGTTGKKKTIVSLNPTWFKKGHIPSHPFKKGSIPSNKGKKRSPEVVEKTAAKLRGRKFIGERLEKQRKICIQNGKNRRNGEGRRSFKNREWARLVYERDGFTCKRCGSTEKLHAHHIISWKESVDLRFEVSNGITYCNSCHLSVEMAERKNKTKV